MEWLLLCSLDYVFPGEDWNVCVGELCVGIIVGGARLVCIKLVYAPHEAAEVPIIKREWIAAVSVGQVSLHRLHLLATLVEGALVDRFRVEGECRLLGDAAMSRGFCIP